MKGDFSRVTFDPKKHYNSVLYQQGRVLTDADFNEAQAIGEHRAKTTAAHVIGPAGTPKFDVIDGQTLPNGGFALSIGTDGDLLIGRGHYYVEGILCVNEADTPYLQQPHLPDQTKLVEALQKFDATVGLIYLDVFARERTALDDPSLREGVLAGPDTTARAETIWQVKVEPLEDITLTSAAQKELAERAVTIRDLQEKLAASTDPKEQQALRRQLRDELRAQSAAAEPFNITCDAEHEDWTRITGARNPQMAVDTPPVSPEAGPCDAPPEADFLGQENQLYRVEVHSTDASGSRSATRFKWSRENGSVVAAIERVGATTSGTGTGNVLGVHSTGRDSYLGFHQDDWVEYIDDQLELTNGAGVLVQITVIDPEINEITLSSNITVRFDQNPKLRRWDQGAETSRRNGDTDPITNSSDGIPMNSDDSTWLLLEHNIWVQFADEVYRPGDYWIFAARAGTGTVDFPPGFQPAAGVQHHYARLGYLLLDTAQNLNILLDCRPLFPPLTDIAAEDVSFDNSLCELPDTLTVQDAIEQLCQRGSGGGCDITIGKGGQYELLEEAIEALRAAGEVTWCFCLLPGEHRLSNESLFEGAKHVSISACSHGVLLILEQPIVVKGLLSFKLSGMSILNHAPMGLAFSNCQEVTIADISLSDGDHDSGEGDIHCVESGSLTMHGVTIRAFHRQVLVNCEATEMVNIHNCQLSGQENVPFIIRIGHARRIVLGENQVTAPAIPDELTRVIFQVEPLLVSLFEITDREVFIQKAGDAAQEIMRRTVDERASIAKDILEQMRNLGDRVPRRDGQLYQAIADSIEDGRLVGLVELFAALQTLSVALVLRDGEADTTLHANVIIGLVSLYGEPGPTEISNNVERLSILKRVILQRGLEPITAGGTLQMNGNHFTRLVLSEEAVKWVLVAQDQGQPPTEIDIRIYQTYLLTDNVIDIGRNYFMADRISLTSTHFRSPVFEASGMSIGFAATFVSNEHYESTSEFAFVNVCPVRIETPNLNLMEIDHI